MKFFDGLYNYEIVLLVLGGLLFLVALAKLIRGKPNAGLVVFFLLSGSMIGYPSVQSIDYQKGVLSIKKQVHDLEADPGNEALRTSLQQDISKVQDRPSKEPETSLTLAQAHFALGNEAAAKQNLAAATEKNPELPEANDLSKKIELSDRLKVQTAKAEAAPNDAAARAQLDQTVSQVNQTRIANPTTLHNVTRAQTILKTQPVAIRPNAVMNPNLRNRLAIEPHPATSNH